MPWVAGSGDGKRPKSWPWSMRPGPRELQALPPGPVQDNLAAIAAFVVERIFSGGWIDSDQETYSRRELASQRKREEVLKEPPQELTGDLKADMALIKSLSTTVRILFFGNLPWVPKNGWRPASSMPMPGQQTGHRPGYNAGSHALGRDWSGRASPSPGAMPSNT